MGKLRIIGENGYIGSTLTDLPDVKATILLAGHSSVAMCENHPDEAWANNVDFFREVLRTIEPGEKFIYASSASVYDGVENPSEDCTEFNLKGMYDLTKRTIDDLARLSDVEYYGLRFATVNGWSPNLRIDVMMNKMYFDATEDGVIKVQNGQLKRPILGINDLNRAITAILKSKKDKRGIYNLASFTESVEDMAKFIAECTGAKVEIAPNDRPPYAFGINTEKFEKNFKFKFEDDVWSVLRTLISHDFERVGVRV